jgi:antitoxin PrlF
MTATVTAKGQVTIPKSVRDLLGIAPGSKVDFRRAADGSVVLVRADGKRPASRFARLRADSNSLRTAVLTGSRTLILMIADSCR